MMIKNSKDKLDLEIENMICCTTGKLYVMANNMGFNMNNFSDLFLTSKFCSHAFDSPYSRFQTEDEDVSMDYLLKEISPQKEKSNEMLTEDAAFWIGFIYRYLYFKTGIQSSILKDKVTFEYLQRKFYGLSTIDEKNAVDIICNDCKINMH